MATELRVVINLLTDYLTALGTQRQQVAESHAELVNRFQALAEVYDGASFREFAAGWRQTEEAFGSYIQGVAPLLDLLSEKRDDLRRLDGGQ